MVCVHQEGSGFEDFDSDAEIIRVSELPLSVTSDFFFLWTPCSLCHVWLKVVVCFGSEIAPF